MKNSAEDDQNIPGNELRSPRQAQREPEASPSGGFATMVSLTDLVPKTLFFEFHGSESSNKEAIKLVEELSKNNGGGDFKWAVSLEERNKLWQARHDVYWSVKALGNNMKFYTTDVCVPISNLVECIKFAEEVIKKSL